MSPELLDRLRNLSIADTLHCAQADFGLSIQIDTGALSQWLQRLDLAKDGREAFESLIRAGASPRLIARLFGMSDVDVRRARRLISPDAAGGGRPRLPPDGMRDAIRDAWIAVCGAVKGERQQYLALAERFPDYALVGLESVVCPSN